MRDNIKHGVLVYLSVNGKVLMMKKGIRENDPNSGYYVPPGGNLEFYEKGLNKPLGRLEAAVREPLEESGLTLINPIYRGVILFHNFEREFPNWPNPEDFFVNVYSATQYTGKPGKGKNNEFPVWIDEEKISELPQNPGDKMIYEWLKDGRFFVGVIKHKGKELDKEGTYVDFA